MNPRRCEVRAFKGQKQVAETSLLKEIEQYFQSADFDPRNKVRRTSLPPIYFQHRGESATSPSSPYHIISPIIIVFSWNAVVQAHVVTDQTTR